MASFEDELRLDDEENRREIAFIRERLPQEVKPHFSEDDLYYFLDAIIDYYYESGILESTEEEVDIDLQEVANAVTQKALRDKQGNFDPEEVFYVVEADMDFQEENL
jgi:DNA-directed RNA polymerase specialized sigma54-like protein